MSRRLLLAALAVFALAAPTRARAGDAISLSVWQHLPVLQNGRVMPMDSYARNLLLSFSGKSTFDRKPASQWLARVLFTPEETRGDAIFLINNPEVVEALGLEAHGRGRYSFAQLQPALAELTRLARAAFHLEDDARSPVETELMRLFNNIDQYNRLCQGLDFAAPRPEFNVTDAKLREDLDLPAGVVPTLQEMRSRAGRISELVAANRSVPADERTAYQQELFRLSMSSRMWAQGRQGLPPSMIPGGPRSGGEWIGPWDALGMATMSEDLAREADALSEMAKAFRAGQQVAFNIAARDFASSTGKRIEDKRLVGKLKKEVLFNRSDAFYRAELLYGFAFLLALLSVAIRGRWIYVAALGLTAIALVPHTYGIIARMMIMGRPPVTNLYATFVFVGWVCALLGLVTEYVQRNRLGLITAATSGLALLLTAGRFGDDGDTMGVMVAVLDSNFWLATHVVCISIGYAGCCVAGLLGHIYLLQAIRREPNDPGLLETYNAVYGALAFGLIFSFVGTMLGGVWADQSWGRFWGWDPKENGALVIVLWSAIVFHARVGRMIGNLGFAAGAVLGVIGVLLAWLGVNLLGVGLHSYGFTSGIARGLFIACMFEITFVALTVPFARRAGR